MKEDSDSRPLTQLEAANLPATLVGSETCTYNHHPKEPQEYEDGGVKHMGIHTPEYGGIERMGIQTHEDGGIFPSPQTHQVSSIWLESKDALLRELTTDSVNVHPVKRCTKCTNCTDCKKKHLPDPNRQHDQAKIIRDSLKF